MEIKKLKDGFMLKEVVGSYIVVPVGDNLVDFSAMITVNETGAFLWKLLENGASVSEMVAKMVAEYDIDEATAQRDIDNFLKILTENQLAE